MKLASSARVRRTVCGKGKLSGFNQLVGCKTQRGRRMSSSQTTKLIRSAPYFPVSNVERSVTFYEEVLGFRCEYSAGTPLQFAICSRDGLAIMLRRVDAPELIVPNEKAGRNVGGVLLGQRRASFTLRDRYRSQNLGPQGRAYAFESLSRSRSADASSG